VSGEYTQGYPENSQAVLALVLGILGLVACGILAPFAWSVANTELRGIDAGRRPPDNRGLANAGRILGIIGTVFLGLALLVLIVLLAGVLLNAGTT
jgi:TRAP-type C4-dicarboxylate transport system permease small subunit